MTKKHGVGAIVAMSVVIACAGSGSTSSAFTCREDAAACFCMKGKDPDPGGSRSLVSSCTTVGDCCSLEHYNDGDSCNCYHDPGNPVSGAGAKGCQGYRDLFIKVPYEAVAKCP